MFVSALRRDRWNANQAQHSVCCRQVQAGCLRDRQFAAEAEIHLTAALDHDAVVGEAEIGLARELHDASVTEGTYFVRTATDFHAIADTAVALTLLATEVIDAVGRAIKREANQLIGGVVGRDVGGADVGRCRADRSDGEGALAPPFVRQAATYDETRAIGLGKRSGVSAGRAFVGVDRFGKSGGCCGSQPRCRAGNARVAAIAASRDERREGGELVAGTTVVADLIQSIGAGLVGQS